MVDLNEYLADIKPDPVRSWIATLKSEGAYNMFTIGVPDPIPQEILEVYSNAVRREEMSGKTSYTPITGEEDFKKALIRMERKFNVDLAATDSDLIIPTVGASQALQFVFSLFKQGSEILVQSPGWGTVYNLIAHSGNKGVACEYFENGEFVPENVDDAMGRHTQAAYLNVPSNPAGHMPEGEEIAAFTEYCVEKGLQVISDSPYKYHLYDGRYYSPINAGGQISDNVILVSSFSKIIKPDIRLGYVRLSPSMRDAKMGKNIASYFRNLGAGTPRAIQMGVKAVIDHDPDLHFLKRIVQGYREKSKVMMEFLIDRGFNFETRPNASYLMFPQTPGLVDGEYYVMEMAKKHGVGFLPGSSFSGGIEKYHKNIRVGIGGGKTVEEIKEIMEPIQ